MKRASAPFFALVTLVTLLLATGNVWAAGNPERAGADIQEITKELHAYCDTPRFPPSASAVRLCSLAREVPNCAGFAKQCDDILDKKVEPPPAWLEDIARAFMIIAPYVGWGVLILGALTLLYLIAVAIYRRVTRREAADDTPPSSRVAIVQEKAAPEVEPGSPEAILARAEAALARGDLQAALFGFLFAALRALDVRGAIRITRDRTNGEYVRSCADENARPELGAIVREVDVVQFGGRAPDAERVRDAGRRATMLVRGVTMLLLLFSLGACNGGALPRANDPAGFEVARELLKRQGFVIKRAPVSLARLQMPKDAAAEAPMFINTSQTMLDDDAIKGLERWVLGGGHLVLVGSPWTWPRPFRARSEPVTSRDVIVNPALAMFDCPEASDECEEKAAEALAKMHDTPYRARLPVGAAFQWMEKEGKPVAVHDGSPAVYAGIGEFGSGWVLGIASDDLVTNVGLAREGNGAALIAILMHLESQELVIVDEHGGITPVSNPLAALVKAGLGVPLAHAFLFTLVLALAVGARMRAPRAAPTPARRAFAEHVLATAALYSHARAAPHALASYGRFVMERMQRRATKGNDVPTTMAQRAGVPKEQVQEVLDRALHVRAGDQRRGDELATLRDLCELYTRAEGPMEAHQAKGSGILRFARRRR